MARNLRLLLLGVLALTIALIGATAARAEDAPGDDSQLVDVSHQLGDLGKKLVSGNRKDGLPGRASSLRQPTAASATRRRSSPRGATRRTTA